MKTAHCIVSKAPIRQDPSDKAEIVTEMLFGEAVEVLNKQEKWWQIACNWDGYQGWIDPKQVAFLREEEDLRKKHCSSSALWNVPTNQGVFNLPIGAEFFLDMDNSSGLGAIEFDFKAESDLRLSPKPELLAVAMRFLNTPYLWGGRSNYGIDCSGFTQVCHKVCGIQLPRDAYQQAEVGEEISFVKSKERDLAFFVNAKGRVIHVGIILPDNNIIHAHGKVRIDRLDERGIYNEDMGRYTHELSMIRRIL